MKTTGNTVIIGDSYSTFEGYIPEGYAFYYSTWGRRTEDGKPVTDVNKVEQTWWSRLLKDTGGILLRNDSWSGTTVCHTGYDGADRSEISFVARAKRLIEGGFFTENKVDSLFVFGLTNDNWAGSPTGGIKLARQTEKDLYKVLPALSYLLQILRKAAPETKIYFILNTDLDPHLSEAAKIICEKTGVKCIVLKDIDKACGHPTVKGMEQIAKQVEKNL